VACTDICLALFDIGIALCDIDAFGLVPFKRVIGLNRDRDVVVAALLLLAVCASAETVRIIQPPMPSAILRNVLTEIAIRSVHDVIYFLSNRLASIPKIPSLLKISSFWP
jgi:hypothetical protein